MKKLSLLFLTVILGISIFSGCQNHSSSDLVPSSSENESTTATNKNTIGSFTTIDVFENTYTDAIFADYELTLVNVCATWCGPCVKELPHLETIYQEMKDEGVNVIAFVLDTTLANGDPWKPYVSKAKTLATKSGVTFPFLVPDKTFLNGRLKEFEALPTTIFVDQKGNIVGLTYVGSRNYDQWKAIVEKELKRVRGELY